MKNLLIPALVLFLIVSCKQQPERWTNNSAEIDLVKAHMADYQSGDWDAWVSHYADSAKVYHNTTAASSPADLMNGFKETLKNVSEYKFSDQDIYYEMIIDDKNQKWVNFWGTWEGTVGATGKDLVIPVHLTLQLAEGKIVEEHGFYNMADYVAAMNEVAAMAEKEEAEEEMEEE